MCGVSGFLAGGCTDISLSLAVRKVIDRYVASGPSGQSDQGEIGIGTQLAHTSAEEAERLCKRRELT
jgi:hypothetical protein